MNCCAAIFASRNSQLLATSLLVYLLDRNRLECPSCRLETKFGPGKGPGSLNINVNTVRHLEMVDSSCEAKVKSREEIMKSACINHSIDGSTGSMCMNCDDDLPSLGDWGCIECSASLCGDCKTAHLKQKLFRSHQLLTIEEFHRVRTSTCANHLNECINSVCNDCDVLVCAFGAFICHGGHKISSLQDSITREQAKLESCLQATERLMAEMRSKIELVQRGVQDHRQNMTAQHCDIDADTAQLMELITRRAAAAHEEVELRGGESIRAAEAQQEAMEGWLSRTGGCVESAGRVLVAERGAAVFTEYQELHRNMSALVQEQAGKNFTGKGDKQSGGSRNRYTGSVGMGSSPAVGGAVVCGGTASGSPATTAAAVVTNAVDASCGIMRLIVDRGVTGKMCSLVDSLFALQEAPAVVWTIHPRTRQLTRLQGGIIGLADNLSSPCGLALRRAAPGSDLPSLLFVCDVISNQILVIEFISGVFIRSIGYCVAGEAAGQLSYPRDCELRVLPSGRSLLYVSDSRNSRIQVFDADSGAHVHMLGVDEIADPSGLALHEATTSCITTTQSYLPALLFVASFSQHVVKVFNADTGSLVRTIGTGIAGAGMGEMNGPVGIAVRTAAAVGSASQLLLYVSENGNHRIQVFDATTGAHVRMIGTKGAAQGQLSSPWGIALQQSYRLLGSPALLYVADSSNHRVQVFDADTGAYVCIIGAGKGNAPGQLNWPINVFPQPGTDGSTLVFVSESCLGNARLQVFVV